MASKKRKKRTPVSRRTRRLVASCLSVIILGLIPLQRLGYLGPLPEGDRSRYHDKAFTVTKVVDGDTLDIRIPDATTGKDFTRIRLWGVDTPETSHSPGGENYFGPEAARFTTELALNRQVLVQLEPFENTRGKYGRLLAYVYLPDGRLLNEILITEGYAYADPRFEHMLKQRFLQLEKNAQRDKKGLWENVTPEQWPSWYQRYQDRKKAG
ncbi:MAG: thermonuclease family protein [Sedimentisphaerales bacterium]|nr:thermonuclease family protein [Sedimentisphaerales bacterium]